MEPQIQVYTKVVILISILKYDPPIRFSCLTPFWQNLQRVTNNSDHRRVIRTPSRKSHSSARLEADLFKSDWNQRATLKVETHDRPILYELCAFEAGSLGDRTPSGSFWYMPTIALFWKNENRTSNKLSLFTLFIDNRTNLQNSDTISYTMLDTYLIWLTSFNLKGHVLWGPGLPCAQCWGSPQVYQS